MSRPVKYPMIAVLILFSAACFLGALLLLSVANGRRGIDVSPEWANSQIHQKFQIPNSAAKVRFITYYSHSFVTVWLTETDFLEWARERGWDLVEVKAEEGVIMTVLDPNGQEVHRRQGNGWGFTEDKRAGFGGWYDIEKGIASVGYFSD